MKTKIYYFSATGGSEELQLAEESDLPEPQDNEVRVKASYTGANFTDIMIRSRSTSNH